MLDSKKWRAALVAAGIAFLSVLLQKFGVDVTQEQLWTLLAPLLVYIGAQGLADLGKSRAEAIDAGTIGRLRALSSRTAKKIDE